MSSQGFTDMDVPDQSGRCILVTGANTGLGFQTARILAAKGARVLLACRNEAKAKQAMTQIREDIPGVDVAFVPLDQADLSSVRRAAEMASQEPRLDVLINNAGIMSKHKGVTKDGLEHHFGVNHLGTFVLTLLLLPKLSEVEGARVVTTSSLVHKVGRMDFDDIASGGEAKPGQLYADSKLANLLFVQELDRRLRAVGSGITAVACHPGMAATELFREPSALMRWLAPLLSKPFNSALQGCWPTLQAATDPAIEAGGYYGPQRMGGVKGPAGPAKRSRLSTSTELARQLWDLSERLSGVTFELA